MTSEKFIKFLQQGRRDRTTEKIISEVTAEQIEFTKQMEAQRKQWLKELQLKGCLTLVDN